MDLHKWHKQENSDEKKESDGATSFVLKSRMDIDGGKAWKTTVEGNELSFEQVHKNNKETNISKVEVHRQEELSRKRLKIGL